MRLTSGMGRSVNVRKNPVRGPYRRELLDLDAAAVAHAVWRRA